jgi:hypothetical protein
VLEKAPAPCSTEPIDSVTVANWTRARYVKEAQGASWVVHQESADDVVLVANAAFYDSVGRKQEPCIIDPARAQDKGSRLYHRSSSFRAPYFDRV